MAEYDVLAQLIVSKYADVFPHSKISCSYGMDKKSIFVKLYMAQNKDESINRILDNDMLMIVFHVELSADGQYTIENNYKHYTINPTNQYCVYGSKGLKFRKVSGDFEKTVNVFEKFFSYLKNELTTSLNSGEIHKNHESLLRSKLGL